LKYMALLALGLAFIIAFNAEAQDKKFNSDTPRGKTGWSTFLRGGYLHQFKTDIDKSSEFSVNRFFYPRRGLLLTTGAAECFFGGRLRIRRL